MRRRRGDCFLKGCRQRPGPTGYCQFHYRLSVRKDWRLPNSIWELPRTQLTQRQLGAISKLPVDAPLSEVSRALVAATPVPASDAPPRPGPPPRTKCRRCHRPEVREGLCPKHWLEWATGHRLRWNLAEKIPIARLTAAQIEAIRNLASRGDWMVIHGIASVPDPTVETLAAEAERAERHAAYSLAGRAVVALLYWWSIKELRLGPPARWRLLPMRPATPEECIAVSLAGYLAECVHRRLEPRRPDEHVWRAITRPAFRPHGIDDDEDAVSIIKTQHEEADDLETLARYREYEAATVRLLQERRMWAAAECVAGELTRRRQLAATEVYSLLVDEALFPLIASPS